MFELGVVWKNDRIEFYIGKIIMCSAQICPRMNGERRRARNLAVAITTYFQFVQKYSNYAHTSFPEAFKHLRDLGATDDDIKRFAALAMEIGWSDIPDVAETVAQLAFDLYVSPAQIAYGNDSNPAGTMNE